MKILAITSRYPPYHFGGYELRSKDIMDALSDRGHVVIVITSKKEKTSKNLHSLAKYNILRRLEIRTKVGDMIDQLTRWRITYALGMSLSLIRGLFFDFEDMKFINGQIEEFQPDVIYLGHIAPLSKAIMPYFATCSIPVVYDEGGSGLVDAWTERGIWHKFIANYLIRYPALKKTKDYIIKFISFLSGNTIRAQWSWPQDMQIIFNSQHNLNFAIAGGVPVNDALVLHSGIDIKNFNCQTNEKLAVPLVLIVPGRIEPRKGQIDAIRLLLKLRERAIQAKIFIVGEVWTRRYFSEIENEIRRYDLEGNVVFIPMMTQAELVDLYHQADICFFPSYQKVGFSRTPLEAMACGCITISYGNEGSNEIVQDNETGFLVPPADYQSLVDIIEELINEPKKVKDILSAARSKVEKDYSIDKYIDKLEEVLVNKARKK